MNGNPFVCLRDYLIVSERPPHGPQSLRALRDRERGGKKATARDGGRVGGERMGDGVGGGRTGITIKQPLTAHTTPEQLTEELQQRRRRRAGGGGGEWAADGGEKTCSLSRNDAERRVEQRGWCWGAGRGTLQLSETAR